MNPINHEIFEMIREDVEDGYLLEDKNAATYHEDLDAWSVSYEVEWYPEEDQKEETDSPEDSEDNSLEEDECYSFIINLYVFKDNTFKIHFDPALLDFMYKGYDTKDVRKAYTELVNLARERGVLFQK